MINLNRTIHRPQVNSLSYKSVILRTPSVVDDVILSPQERTINGEHVKIFNVRRDIALLLNQVRIDNLDIDSLRKYFETNSTDTLSELRSQVTDEQLLATCKSRYIQRTSELQMYFNDLERQYHNDAERVVSMIKSQQQTEPTNTEPNE